MMEGFQNDWLHDQTWGSLLNKCSNLFGALDPYIREQLIRALEDPCEETWNDASSIIIGSGTVHTMWQGWVAIDPSAPRRLAARPGMATGPWPSIPTREQMIEIMNTYGGGREDG
jgi:hypothetical protein